MVVSLGALLARESASLPIGRMRVLSRSCRGWVLIESTLIKGEGLGKEVKKF